MTFKANEIEQYPYLVYTDDAGNVYDPNGGGGGGGFDFGIFVSIKVQGLGVYDTYNATLSIDDQAIGYFENQVPEQSIGTVGGITVELALPNIYEVADATFLNSQIEFTDYEESTVEDAKIIKFIAPKLEESDIILFIVIPIG